MATLEGQLERGQSVVLLARGDGAGAVAEARRALVTALAIGPAPSELRVQAMTTLGSLLIASSSDAEGRRLLWSALRLVDSLPDPDVVAKAEALYALVATGTAGPQSDSLGREVFRIYERATGPNSLAVARQLWLRGATARVRGDTLTQRVSLLRAMAIVQAHPASPAELRQTVEMEYARTHWLAGNMDSAVAVARAVYQERSTTAPGFPTAEAGQLLGTLLMIRGDRSPVEARADYLAAEPILRRADSTVRAILPATHYWAYTTAGSLVRLYRRLGKGLLVERYQALLPDSLRMRAEPSRRPAR